MATLHLLGVAEDGSTPVTSIKTSQAIGCRVDQSTDLELAVVRENGNPFDLAGCDVSLVIADTLTIGGTVTDAANGLALFTVSPGSIETGGYRYSVTVVFGNATYEVISACDFDILSSEDE